VERLSQVASHKKVTRQQPPNDQVCRNHIVGKMGMYAGANKGRMKGCIHHLVRGYQWRFWQGWGCRHDAQ